MATKLGTLTLDLVAKTGNFTTPMQQAESQAKSSGDNIAESFSIASVAAKALGIAIAGISAGGIVSFASQTINASNEIKKFSELANASTYDFQYYAKGAEVAGYSLEQFASVNKDVLDRLGEARRGEGEMMDFFERIAPKIGVTIDQFKNLSGPDALQAYYNGLQKANLSHEEQITYMEQLADDASLLIPLLRNGGEGFDKWGQAAERANAIMSDEMIENLAIAKENIKFLDLQWQGFQNTLINNSIPAIQAVTANMDVISNTTMVAGAYLVGAYIPALYKSVLAQTAKIGAITQGIRAEQIANEITAQRTARIAHLTTVELANAEAQLARMSGMARIAYLERTVLPLRQANTAALAADTVAQNANNASKSLGIRVGTGLLGVLGGPVGIGLTVATIAAGYLLLRDNTAEATAELDRQASVASKTKDELLALEGAQRRAAQEDLKSAFQEQNKALKDLDQQFNSAVISIQNYATQNQVSYESLDKVRDISNKVRQGLISQQDAVEQLNGLYFVTPEQIREVTDLSSKYDEQRVKTQSTADAQAVYGVKVELAGNKASNAVPSIDSNSNALDNNASSALGAAAAQSEYMQKLQQSAAQTAAINILVEKKGWSPERAKAHMEAYFQNGKKLSVEDSRLIDYNLAQNAKLQASTEAVSKAKAAGAKVSKAAQAQAKKETKDATDELRLREQYEYAYADRERQIEISLAKEVAEIRKAKFDNPDTYVEAANKRAYYEKQIYLSQLQYEINEFQMTEEQKLKYSFDIKSLQLEQSAEMSEKNKQIAIKALDDQYAIELRKAKWHAVEMQQAMQEGIKGLSGDADNIFAKATMSPTEFAGWSLQNDRDNAKAALKNQHVGVQQDIMSASPGVYATGEDRYAALLQAHKEYRYGLAAIDVQYDQQVKDLAQSQHDTQMNIWQDLLTRTGTIFNDMAAMVKETSGESSAAYKAMFLVNQGISVAQALINTEVAATKAMAEGGMIAGIPMATAIRTLGYASVGLIAGQTIAGMAHNGINNIPREGTWLLDGGERVLNPQQNKDLTNYLANQTSGSGSKVPNVNIYTLPGQTADVSTNSDGSLDVRIRKIAGEYLNGQLSNPNSQTSKTMKQNFNITQKR